MSPLSGSRTEDNLKRALAAESVAATRYFHFAQEAEVEGRPEAAALFRSLAERERGRAVGLLELLVDAGDPSTGLPMDSTDEQLRSAIAAEEADAAGMYPDMVATARDEGLNEVADWLGQLAEAASDNAERLRPLLDGDG